MRVWRDKRQALIIKLSISNNKMASLLKMSEIFSIFYKNKVNSRAIDCSFRGYRGNLSYFYLSYLSCKDLSIL